MKASIRKAAILLLVAALAIIDFLPGLVWETPRHIAAGATPTPTPKPTHIRQEASTTVEVDSVIIKPGPGHSGNVQVWVKNVADPTGLGAYDISITFDITKIKINAVSGGDAPFNIIAAHNAVADANGANSTGTLSLNGFHTSSPGPTGNVYIATVNVSGLVAGNHGMTPFVTTLVNVSGADIGCTTTGGAVFAYDPPVADFSGSPTSSAVPLSVNFTDLSTGPATAWGWDLDGNGTLDSSTRNPGFTYMNPGNYTVSLTAGNPQGLNTITRSNYIHAYGSPNADFTANKTRGRAPLTVNFNDQSTGNITGWEWDLNADSTIDTSSRNPTYRYTRSGTYTVSLKATNPLGNDTETRANFITVTKLKVKKFFRVEVDSDGVVVLPIDIGDLTDPDTGEKVKPNKGIKEFRGEVNFNSLMATMLGGRGGPNFNNPNMSNSAGKSTFSGSSNNSSIHDTETRIAKLIPRLMGNKDAIFDFILNLQSITEGDDETEMEEEETTTLSFRRGAARGGTFSNITDALFIAQYLAGVRDISNLNPLNAASIMHDGAGGDKISITDAMVLAQVLAGLRDSSFNLIP